MKLLQRHTFQPGQCRREWHEFCALLASKPALGERRDVLPFFKTRHNLSLLICTYLSKIKHPDRIAHEYQIYGDFVADLVVGDSTERRYLLIEFEDASPESIFRKRGRKATPDWAPRFEGAHSQLLDWLWKLEDMRSTADFLNTFGDRRATFQAIIVIGKDIVHSPQEADRLKWRMERTLVDSNAISCVTYDQLAVDLDHWLKTYYGV